MATRISNAAAIAACNAIVDLLDAGTASPNLGYIEIRVGTQPADPDTAPTGALLGTLYLQGSEAGTAFGNASDAGPGGQSAANTIASDVSADATGIAGWFRGYDSDGSAIVDGNITATSGGGDMELDDINIVIGGTIAVSSWTITVPES